MSTTHFVKIFSADLMTTLPVSEQAMMMPPIIQINTQSDWLLICPVLMTSYATFDFNALALLLIYFFFLIKTNLISLSLHRSLEAVAREQVTTF